MCTALRNFTPFLMLDNFKVRLLAPSRLRKTPTPLHRRSLPALVSPTIVSLLFLLRLELLAYRVAYLSPQVKGLPHDSRTQGHNR
jgi:hypothetical protein